VAGRVGCAARLAGASMGAGARGFWRLQARALLGVGVAGRLGAALARRARGWGSAASGQSSAGAAGWLRGRVLARLLLACRGTRSRGAGGGGRGKGNGRRWLEGGEGASGWGGVARGPGGATGWGRRLEVAWTAPEGWRLEREKKNLQWLWYQVEWEKP
jgi:hypothetical protein